LAPVACTRCRVEEFLEDCKSNLGMTQYETRRNEERHQSAWMLVHAAVEWAEPRTGRCLRVPDWSWPRSLLKTRLVRTVDRIWAEDLRVGVCHGGWPGLPKS
jgi:hypothetical protein